MREVHELVVAVQDGLRRQGAEALWAEVFAGERPKDIAVDQCAAVVVEAERLPRGKPLREIAEKAASEGITRACWVAHLVERITGRGKEAAVGAEEQRAIRALLDHQQARAEVENAAGCAAQTRRGGILAHLI